MRGASRSLAQVVADLCDGLGLGQVDLVDNDAGRAVAQIFAARHPDKVRSFTLTNCDCEGNFPPPEFAPVIEQARQGTLAPALAALAVDPAASPLGAAMNIPNWFPRRYGAATSR